jgi:hypothetical protein
MDSDSLLPGTHTQGRGATVMKNIPFMKSDQSKTSVT